MVLGMASVLGGAVSSPGVARQGGLGALILTDLRESRKPSRPPSMAPLRRPTMTTSDEMHAFFESKQFEQLQRYLEQGRGFAKLSDDDLNQRWISELRYWVANFGSRVDHRLQEDIEAELQIRGLEPPFALVPEEF